jgi:hypothetical protein
MRLFRAHKQPAPAGPPPSEMRGRAEEISDPAAFGWQVMWEALKTEPEADDPSTLTQELGLDQEQWIAPGWGNGDSSMATEFSGTRHGRSVSLRMGVFPRFIRGACNEVQLSVPVVAFRVRVADGRPVVEEGGTPELAGLLATLAPAPEVWRKLEVDGGPDGIVARRPVTAHPQGYLYDLWLVERIADRVGV